MCVDMSKLLLLTKNKTINNNKLKIIFINWNKVEQLNKTEKKRKLKCKKLKKLKL